MILLLKGSENSINESLKYLKVVFQILTVFHSVLILKTNYNRQNRRIRPVSFCPNKDKCCILRELLTYNEILLLFHFQLSLSIQSFLFLLYQALDPPIPDTEDSSQLFREKVLSDLITFSVILSQLIVNWQGHHHS